MQNLFKFIIYQDFSILKININLPNILVILNICHLYIYADIWCWGIWRISHVFSFDDEQQDQHLFERSHAFVIHGKCHDNFSASSIPFYFLRKLGADATNARRKTSERGDVENCPIIRG